MSAQLASALLSALGVYLAAGGLFALLFLVLGGAGRIDPAAREGTLGFRLLILPGCALLWPILLPRWIRGTSPPAERNAHRAAARRTAAE